MNLEGRSAIVAGGAGGLGSATTRHLTDLGVRVVVLDQDRERSDELVADVGGRAAFVAGSSSDDDAVAAAISAARSIGEFSIAVSATGVVIRSPRLVEGDGIPMSKEILMKNLDLHVVGPFNLARLAAAAFTLNAPDDDGQRGVIVQTASISAFDGQATMTSYAAAKGAIVSMTLPMARDLAPIGVRVCSIAPGGFLTPRLSSPETQQLLLQDVLFPKRLGDPAEYAHLVASIVQNPYLNGEVIRLDAGTRLGPCMGSRHSAS